MEISSPSGRSANELLLVGLVLERVERLDLVELGALERLRLGDDLAHARLDRLEVLGRERPGHVEVVVEAVLDGGADGDLRHREELDHRLGHDVRGRVPQDVERVGAPVGDDLDASRRRRARWRCRRGCRRPCRRGRRRRAASRSTAARSRTVEPSGTDLLAAVGQGDGDLGHGALLLSWRPGDDPGDAAARHTGRAVATGGAVDGAGVTASSCSTDRPASSASAPCRSSRRTS